ncbi:MAG: hypothetical protein GF329_09435 [Candidatus Lokiarchaeota archaeon]|nr:hypothetical protein [Candidatus Lokiarchaeota archaeon]
MVELEDIIKNIMYIRHGGLLLFSLVDSSSGKLDIVSSFLEAIKSFSGELDGMGELRSIKLSNMTLSYYKNNRSFYIILIHRSSFPIESLTKFLETISEKFIQRYSEDQIDNWNHDINLFKPFMKVLRDEMKAFSESNAILEGKGKALIDELYKKIVKEKDILAISIIEPSKNVIQSRVDPKLDDFELQVYISSSFYNRTLLNLGTNLTSIGNVLIGSDDFYHIIKTDRFYLGIKSIENKYLGVLSKSYDSIKSILPEI